MLFLSGLVYNSIMTSVSLIHIAADLSFGVSFVPSVRSKCLFIVELQWVSWVVAEVPFPLDLQLRALCLWHCPDWPFQRSTHEARSLGSKVRLRSVGCGLDDDEIWTYVLFTCPSLTFSCEACHDFTHEEWSIWLRGVHHLCLCILLLESESSLNSDAVILQLFILHFSWCRAAHILSPSVS